MDPNAEARAQQHRLQRLRRGREENIRRASISRPPSSISLHFLHFRILFNLFYIGAEFVIALTHMRIHNDEKLALSNSGVDLILGGHDHFYCVISLFSSLLHLMYSFYVILGKERERYAHREGRNGLPRPHRGQRLQREERFSSFPISSSILYLF